MVNSTMCTKFILNFALILNLLAVLAVPCQAIETAPRISDREIVERLSKLEEGQKAILREMDNRFDAMDKRFESIDKRFESLDKRFISIDSRFVSMDQRFDSIDSKFISMDKRFDQLNNLMIGMMATFGGLVAAIIGFAIWDRMSFLARSKKQAKEV